jgi:flavoprotein
MMFMGGDYPFVHIKTSNTTGRKLLVFKESYGNAFVPYMIDYYDEIVVVDIREKTPGTAKIIADYGITDVLVINNVQAANNASQVKQLAAKTAS